jgi:CelD/BcsL family acetyltransferase involved in cellulose biosynthesis/3-hydroxyisobutyrate dehydrogenase-like beta-hydroxyacid dehydrogenase
VKIFAFIGFGELGSALAARAVQAGGREVRVYTRSPRDQAGERLLDERVLASGVTRTATLEAAVAGADVVVATVPSSEAHKVAADCAPHLGRRAVYVDPSPLLPAVKQESARIIDERGGAYVDAAVLGTVAADGYRVPILACGPGAGAWQDAAAELGLNVSVIEGAPGRASLVKLLRSIYMKGRDALILEMLVAARRHGVEDAVVESVNGSGEGVPFPALAKRVMSALAVHAERRAGELDSSAALLEEVDVEPIVTRAGAERLRWLAELGLRDHFGGRRPDDLHDVLRVIERAGEKPSEVEAPRTPVVITEHSIEQLADEWEALAERLRATPFLRPDWFAAWSRAFTNGELELLAARRGRELCGVLPVHKDGRGVRSASNWHSPLFGALAENQDVRRALVQHLFTSDPRRVTLAFLGSETDDLGQCRQAAAEAGYRILTRVLQRSPYVAIDRGWDDFEQQRGRSVRDLPRRLRRLEKEGRVEIEVADGTERFDELLAEGLAVEPSGWKANRGSAIVSSLDTRNFYTEVARWAAERGWLRMMFLRLDGRALAFQYNLMQHGVWYYIKGGYDPAYARFSPGRLLIRAAIEHAFSLGLDSYEFLGGDEPFKLEWTTTTRERTLFQAFAPSPAGLVGWSVYAHGRPLAKRICPEPVARLVGR